MLLFIYCRQGASGWNTTVAEIYKMIGLLFARGILAKGFPLKELWNRQWAPKLFSGVMSRDRFISLVRFLRFDEKQTRQARLRNDKFALFSDVWNRFIANSQKCYKPSPFLTIDEQLFPTKVRCKFLQYMANKPDKFGIKFFLLANVDKPYVFNGFPYLGADDTRPANILLSQHVVMQLLTPYFGSGYNITLDNFFTSKKIAEACLEKNITIIGTIRGNRKELPSNLSQISNAKALYSTVAYRSENCLLTSYKCKRNKSVYLLSTYHSELDYLTSKKKPSTVTDYNATKYGVDVIDQMAKHFTCKFKCRRWPVQTFCNVLDLSAINAYTLFVSVSGSKISRRTFMLQLISELICLDQPIETIETGSMSARIPDIHVHVGPQVRRQCQIGRCQNKTGYKCTSCLKFTCGKCAIKAPLTCKNCVP